MALYRLHLSSRLQALQARFGGDPTLVLRRFTAAGGISCALLYFDGMTNASYISDFILRLAQQTAAARPDAAYFREQAVAACEARETESEDQMSAALLDGDCLLLIDRAPAVLILSAKGYPLRNPAEPENEKVSAGSRDGFIESLIPNIALLRRRLYTDKLRLRFYPLSGGASRLCLCYIEGKAPESLIAEAERRIAALEGTVITDMNTLCERLNEHPASPFRSLGLTERPDTAASKLLEGRVGFLLDGSPCMASAPFFFIEYFQSPDDYTQNYLLASFSRALRIFCFFLSVAVPALYVALLRFHQELIPVKLLLSVAAAREGVPFPLLIETLVLLLAFEILRDASYRMSPTLGQSLSIVGALILGQAAVEARLVSAPVVIVAALTGVAGLINPQLKSVSVLARFSLLLLASFGGLWGVLFGLCVLLLAVSFLSSFGYPFSDYLLPDRRGVFSDSVFRAPWRHLKIKPLTGEHHGKEN